MSIVGKGKSGYVDEVTFGIRVKPADLAIRRFGLEDGTKPVPAQKREAIRQDSDAKFTANTLEYGNVSVEIPANMFSLIDLKELSYIAAVIETLESTTPDKRHSIKIMKPEEAYALPSRTYHAETDTVVEQFDVPGCHVKTLKGTLLAIDPSGVLIEETLLGQRVVNGNATTNLLGATSGATEDPEGVAGDNIANLISATPKGPLPMIIGTDSITHSFRAGNGYTVDPQPFILPNWITVTLDSSVTPAVESDIGKTVVGGTSGHTGILTNYDNTNDKYIIAPTTAADLFNIAEPLTITTGTGAGTTAVAGIPKTGGVIKGGVIDLDTSNITTYGAIVGGDDLTSAIKSLSFNVDFAFKEDTFQRSGTNNTGNDISFYVKGRNVEAVAIQMSLTLSPTSDVVALLEDTINEVTTDTIYVKVHKANDVNDWIVLAFAPPTGETVSNVMLDPDGKYGIKNNIQDAYTFSWECKDLIIVGGNAFDTVRSISDT